MSALIHSTLVYLSSEFVRTPLPFYTQVSTILFFGCFFTQQMRKIVFTLIPNANRFRYYYNSQICHLISLL